MPSRLSRLDVCWAPSRKSLGAGQRMASARSGAVVVVVVVEGCVVAVDSAAVSDRLEVERALDSRDAAVQEGVEGRRGGGDGGGGSEGVGGCFTATGKAMMEERWPWWQWDTGQWTGHWGLPAVVAGLPGYFTGAQQRLLTGAQTAQCGMKRAWIQVPATYRSALVFPVLRRIACSS